MMKRILALLLTPFLYTAGCGDDSLAQLPAGPPPPPERQNCREVSIDTAQVQINPVKPNILIILDASGSMTTGSPTRWDASVQAINSIVSTYANRVRFGLSVFPSDASCGAGQIDVAVGENTASAINNTLNASYPDGFTPIASTLRTVLNNPGAAGMADADRPNRIILVTDGEETCEYSTDVESALDSLVTRTPSIPTYVLGFDSGGLLETLNCYAAHGGAANTDTCPGLTTTNCGSQTASCFYPVTSPQTLVDTLAQISQDAVSCSFQLTTVPDNTNFVVVYMELQDGSIVSLGRDQSHQQNWDYDTAANQVTFYGYACDALKQGTGTPYVAYGCG